MPETSRKKWPYPESTQLVSAGGKDIQEDAEVVDQLNDGTYDFMSQQGGVTNLVDWNFFGLNPNVNAVTGECSTQGPSGGISWHVATVTEPGSPGSESAMTRCVTPKQIFKVKPPFLPASGNYACCRWVAEGTRWGQPVTVYIVTGSERGTAREAEEAPPARGNANRITLGQFIIHNNAGSFSVFSGKQIARLAQPLGATTDGSYIEQRAAWEEPLQFGVFHSAAPYLYSSEVATNLISSGVFAVVTVINPPGSAASEFTLFVGGLPIFSKARLTPTSETPDSVNWGFMTSVPWKVVKGNEAATPELFAQYLVI